MVSSAQKHHINFVKWDISKASPRTKRPLLHDFLNSFNKRGNFSGEGLFGSSFASVHLLNSTNRTFLSLARFGILKKDSASIASSKIVMHVLLVAGK